VKINSFLFDHTHTVPGGGSNVPVTGVSLPSSGITMKIGQTAPVTESILPSNATNNEVTWSSSDTNVATVTTAGEVTAVAVGTSTITVITVEGGFTASLLVTVEATNNKILNFEFDQGLANWTLYDWSGSGSTASVEQDAGLSGTNSVRANIGGTDNTGWKIQLQQEVNFNLEVGHTYEISFVAKAE